jgi:hypothetical protein
MELVKTHTILLSEGFDPLRFDNPEIVGLALKIT